MVLHHHTINLREEEVDQMTVIVEKLICELHYVAVEEARIYNEDNDYLKNNLK